MRAMVACPRCHFMNPVKQKACQACGTALPHASAPSHERPMAGRPTLRGMRSPESSSSQSLPAARVDAPPEQPSSDQTMPSMVSPTAEQIRSHRANNTLLGHVSPKLEATAGADPDSRSAPSSRGPVSPIPVSGGAPAPSRPSPISVQARGGVSRQPTLLGHAPLNEARRPPGTARSSTSQTMPSMQAVRSDVASSPSTDAGGEEEGDPPPAVVTPPPLLEEQPLTPHDNLGRTYLAVPAASSPGPESAAKTSPSQPPAFAYTALGAPPPLPARAPPRPVSPASTANQSVAKTMPSQGVETPVATATARIAEPPQALSPNAPPVSLSSIAPPRVSRRAIQSRLGRAVLSLTAMLGGGLLLFSWMWQPATPITGQINATDAAPSLSVFCQSCGDGSHVELDGQRAEFRNQRALLALAAPPHVGTNTFSLQVHRSGMGRDEEVQLQTQVDYKANWDSRGLTATPPRLDVVVEAAPDVSIRVAGSELHITDGKGNVAVELGRAVQGASSSVEWIEKAVEIVTQRGATPSSTNYLKIRVPVVPLTIDTPWNGFQTDSKSVVLSGRTSPKGTVTSPEGSVSADDAGYFELSVTPRPGINPVELVASTAEHAPRSATVSFAQVGNLTAVALAYQEAAVRRFDQLTERLGQDPAPLPVALAGKVQEWKTTHNLTVVLLAVTSGCPSRSCLVRVEYPASIDFTPNEPVSVFGEAQAAPPGMGMLPQVQSHFILH